MPLFGPPNIQKLKQKRDVDGLVKALRRKGDDHVRKRAAEALAEIGGARAVECLIVALKDNDPRVVMHAANALSKAGDAQIEKLRQERDVDALLDALRDEKLKYMFKGAADALGDIGDARAVEPLIAALKDEEPYEGSHAADALVKIGGVAVDALIAVLKEEKGFARLHAANALGDIGDVRAAEPLIAVLKDENEYVRLAAAAALGRIGDARAIQPLIAALKDNDWEVREHAAEALGKIGDVRAVEPLIAALGDAAEGVREAAAEALKRIGGPKAKRGLAEYEAAGGDWSLRRPV